VFTSLLSFGIGFFLEEFQLQMVFSVAVPILFDGVISFGIAFTLQVVAQRDAKPAHAGIFLSLEAVFAVSGVGC
jgi:drug/metabolite transporter (DMT)-like permease